VLKKSKGERILNYSRLLRILESKRLIIMKNIIEILSKILIAIASVLLLGVVLCVFLQVVFRYVLSQPLSWSEELARFLFAWASMLGAAAGAVTILNQGIDLLTKKFSENIQREIDLFARLVTVVTSFILLIKGFELTVRVHDQTSSAIGVRMSFVYVAVPVGLFFIFIIIILDTVNQIYNQRSIKEETLK
jgi:TRAP-type transport system small permease protein